MLGSDLHFREKIPVGILGATGHVGQMFASLLDKHPWFDVTALVASPRSIGKRYGDLTTLPLSQKLANLVIQDHFSNLPCSILFSALDTITAQEVERKYADAGYVVISNTSYARMDPDVPLIVPEINADHLNLLQKQTSSGKLVTTPNCSAVGLTLALKPLLDLFGIEAIHTVTLQALSGAGKKGDTLDIHDNVIPYISSEEEKIETETTKILGSLSNGTIQPFVGKISAQCNRVAVSDGHLGCVSLKLAKPASADEIIAAWRNYRSEAQELFLPFAPEKPVHYHTANDAPQPKLHRDLDKGMAVSIGRLRPCPLFDFKFTILSHNTLRGAAGGALLTAELMVRKEYIYW